MRQTNAMKAWDEIEAEAAKYPHRPGMLNGKRKVRSTMESMGVYHGVKCREYYQNKGIPTPNGTPTFEAMKKEDKYRTDFARRKQVVRVR